MANVEESVYSDPNFAVICSFLEKFGDSCGIPGFTIVTLQEMLEDTRNVHQDLVDLHVKLLRRSGKKSVTHDKWEKVLVKYCHGYSKVDAWEIERFGYKKAKLSVKISLLKRLLEAQFDGSSKFKTDINKLSAEQLRLLPIGKDLKGLMYWFQLDHDLNLRIYCEDQDEETWELVVRERGELVTLIENLETNGNPGLKKEEDSTTPSDTGESKDGEGSLGVHVSQEKHECLSDEKLQFRVPLLISKEEGKPRYEVPASVSLKEEKKLPVKLESMETDIFHSTTLKEETITLKIEKCKSEDSSVSDVPSVEMKETELTVKIKEEPMLIDEDTIVEPKILQRNGSPLQSVTTDHPIHEIINLNQKLAVEEIERNNEPLEKENGLGDTVQDLSSSVRVSVIKLAEKPVKTDASSYSAEAALPDYVPQILTSSAAENSVKEATDLSLVKQNANDMKCDISTLQSIPSVKEPEPVTIVIAPNDSDIKSVFAGCAKKPSNGHGGSDNAGLLLPVEIIEKIVREPMKLDQEPSDKDRCERMKMPLKKRNIPKDLDTGDSRPTVLEKSIKCPIPPNMEIASVQHFEQESNSKLSGIEVDKRDIAITSQLSNLPEPIVPTDNLSISSQFAIVPDDTKVIISDKLEIAPTNSDKPSADIPKEILLNNEKLESSSVELIDTGQSMTLVKKDITPMATEQKQLVVVPVKPSEGCVDATSNASDLVDLNADKLRMKKSVDDSSSLDVVRKQIGVLQSSDNKEKQGEKRTSLLEESELQSQSDSLPTKSLDAKNVQEKSEDAEQTNTESSREIPERIKERTEVKVITQEVVESLKITDEKLPSHQKATGKADTESMDFLEPCEADTQSIKFHKARKMDTANKIATLESVKAVVSDKIDESMKLQSDADNTLANPFLPITVTSLVKIAEKDYSTLPLQEENKFNKKSAEVESLSQQSICSDSHKSNIHETQPALENRLAVLHCESVQKKTVPKTTESSEVQNVEKDENDKVGVGLLYKNSVEVDDKVPLIKGNIVEKTTEELSDSKKSIVHVNTATDFEETCLSDSKRTVSSAKQSRKMGKLISEDDLNSNTIKEKTSFSEEKLMPDQSTIIGEISDSQLVTSTKDLVDEPMDSKLDNDLAMPDVDATNGCQDATGNNEIADITVMEADDNANTSYVVDGDFSIASKFEPVKANLYSKDSDKNTKSTLNKIVIVKRRRSKNAKMSVCQENKEDSLQGDSDKMYIETSIQKSVQKKLQGKAKEIIISPELALNTDSKNLSNEADAAVPERRMTRNLRPRLGQPAMIVKPTRKERKTTPVPKKLTAKQKKAALIENQQIKIPKRMGRPPKGRPKQVKVVTPNKARGRKKAAVESQSLESSDDEDEELTEVSCAPTKKRKLESPDVEDPYSPIKRSPRLQAQRQKVRIEQQLIEEEMQRRALAPKQRRSYQKRKKQGSKWSAKGQEKREAGRKEVIMEEEVDTGKGRKKLKKKKHISSKRRKKGTNPWDVSSESTSASSEPEERNDEADEEDEELVFNDGSDHEFSPESEPEEEDPNYVPTMVKRARTVKQAKTGSEEESSSSEDDKPCNKCGKYDHPEWILLCDKCDCGYHTSCLRPPLLVIPDGDWYCPPCGHKILVERLHEQLKNLDQLLKKREREDMRKKRLAYVGISLDNVLKPEKKESVGDEEEFEEEKDEGDTDDDYTLLRKRSKRQRKEVSYRFKEFDELIKSAIHDEPVLDALETGMTGVGKGKDMSNITNAPEESEFEILSDRKKRKHRRLNDLDTSTEEEDDSDEDFKGTSTNSEQLTEDDSGGAQDSDVSWQGEPRSGRSYRRRGRHDDSDFINDSDLDSEDNRRTVRRAAAKSVNYRELSDSDDGGRKQKRIDNTRSKSSRGAISDDSEEESEDSDWKKSKKHGVSSKSKQRMGRKAWRIDSDDDDDDDDDDDEEEKEEKKDPRLCHTRGKKTSYEEAQDSSNNEEEVRKPKRNSRLNIGDFTKDSEDEESSSEDDTDEEEDDDEEMEKVKEEGMGKEEKGDEKKVGNDTIAAAEIASTQHKKAFETESQLNKSNETESPLITTCITELTPKDTLAVESPPKKSCKTDTVSTAIASQPGKSNVEIMQTVLTSSEKFVESQKSTNETSTPDIAESVTSAVPVMAAVESPAEEALNASVIKSVESVKKKMLEGTKDPSTNRETAEKDLALQKKQEPPVKPLADEPAFMDRVRPGAFPDRPSPLKPSAVEPYPVESSPSKLMLLDTYPPVRGSPQSKLTPLEAYSSPASAPPYDRPRMAGPSSHYHADYGNYPGQYYSPNYPPPSSQYSPSPPMPAYQSSPNPYPPFQQPSPNYGYMPQGYAEQGPYHGPPQQYGPYGNYSPPPQPPPAGPPPQAQSNGRFTIDNLLQRRMEGASEDDDFSTVNDLVSYITGSSSTSQENPL